MTMGDSTKRFSDRVDNYVKFRPKYPSAIISFLKSEIALSANHIVVDVGSGTGLLTEIFLENGNQVYGIEPNTPMREAGEKYLSRYISFVSREGTAEKTTLPESTADLIVAGQAFHWFDPLKTKIEFQRILKPSGFVALIWNDRKTDSRFGEHYEELLKKFGTDYNEVSPNYDSEEKGIESFFEPQPVKLKSFENSQELTFEAFKGRLLSSSYAPAPDHPHFQNMIAALEELFSRYQINQKIKMEYDTKVYFGRLASVQYPPR